MTTNQVELIYIYIIYIFKKSIISFDVNFIMRSFLVLN